MKHITFQTESGRHFSDTVIARFREQNPQTIDYEINDLFAGAVHIVTDDFFPNVVRSALKGYLEDCCHYHNLPKALQCETTLISTYNLQAILTILAMIETDLVQQHNSNSPNLHIIILEEQKPAFSQAILEYPVELIDFIAGLLHGNINPIQKAAYINSFSTIMTANHSTIDKLAAIRKKLKENPNDNSGVQIFVDAVIEAHNLAVETLNITAKANIAKHRLN